MAFILKKTTESGHEVNYWRPIGFRSIDLLAGTFEVVFGGYMSEGARKAGKTPALIEIVQGSIAELGLALTTWQDLTTKTYLYASTDKIKTIKKRVAKTDENGSIVTVKKEVTLEGGEVITEDTGEPIFEEVEEEITQPAPFSLASRG